MCRYLCNVCVVLQVASGDVERKLRAINYALEHNKILGNDLLYVVCNEYLIVVKLYLSFQLIILASQLWEIQNTLEIERIICIDMNAEKGVVKVRENLVIEIIIVLLGALGGTL